MQGKNPRKASIRYEISTGSAYNLDSIIMLADTTALNRLINESARRSAYLRPGSRYSVDSLKQVRIDIANRLRHKGYYFFSPEYIEYLADSTITKGAIALKLDLAANIPSWAMKSYNDCHKPQFGHRHSRHIPDRPRNGHSDAAVAPPP